MRTRSAAWKTATLCVAGLGVLAGAANAQTAPTPKRGGTAIIALGAEPTVVNPVVSGNQPERITGCMVYEGLVGQNIATSQYEPALAESWTISPDGKTYTFKLRKTNWHDGKPFTSEDVRFTFTDVAKFNPTFVAQAGRAIETMTTPDPQTFVVKLKEPFGPFMRVFTCTGGGAIVPAHLFKDTDVLKNPVNQKPVGTGAFKFAEWARGASITFTRNETYWQPGKPYLDRVAVRFMPNGASRIQALLAGEVDFISFSSFASSDHKTVEANPNTKRELTGVAPNMLYAFFNLKRKPLDDVRVRHALLMATDRDYIFNNAFFGSGRPGQAPWATQIEWARDPAVHYDKSHPFNPEKAGQMLEEAGYKADASGIRFKLSLAYDPQFAERNQTASALQAMWRRAGVELTLQPAEAAVLLPRVHTDGNFDVYMSSYQSSGDPALGVGRAYVTAAIGTSFGNAAGYSNPEVDALFDKASTPTSLEERGAIYRQIIPILMRDLPAITLHENRGYDAATRRLHGVWGLAGNGSWENAWISQ